MGRTMPSECPHGFIYDWADFGCECGPNGECTDPSTHRRAERCPEGCNGSLLDAPDSVFPVPRTDTDPRIEAATKALSAFTSTSWHHSVNGKLSDERVVAMLAAADAVDPLRGPTDPRVAELDAEIYAERISDEYWVIRTRSSAWGAEIRIEMPGRVAAILAALVGSEQQ